MNCVLCDCDTSHDEDAKTTGKMVVTSSGWVVLYWCGDCWEDVCHWVDASRGEAGPHDVVPSSTA